LRFERRVGSERRRRVWVASFHAYEVTPPGSHGGARPGAGRKAAAPEAKKIRATVMLRPSTYAALLDMQQLCPPGAPFGAVIDLAVRRLLDFIGEGADR
jgi:hypothetical protein